MDFSYELVKHREDCAQAGAEPAGTLFVSREWTEYLAQHTHGTPIFAKLYDHGAYIGYFCGVRFSLFGLFPVIGSPFYGWWTPYMGLTLFSEATAAYRCAVMDAVLPDIVKETRSVMVQLADGALSARDVEKHLRKFSIQKRSATYQIDLEQSEEALWAGFSGEVRTCIRKFYKMGCTIGEDYSPAFIEEYWKQLEEVFAKQKLTPSFDKQRVYRLYAHLLHGEQLLSIQALSPQGECIASGIFPGSSSMAYFAGNASYTAQQKYRPNEALHLYCMQYWKSKGAKFYDLGGANSYKKKYGGQRKEILTLSYSRIPCLPGMVKLARRIYYASKKILSKPAPGRK